MSSPRWDNHRCMFKCVPSLTPLHSRRHHKSILPIKCVILNSIHIFCGISINPRVLVKESQYKYCLFMIPGKIKIKKHDPPQIMTQMKHLMFSIYIFLWMTTIAQVDHNMSHYQREKIFMSILTFFYFHLPQLIKGYSFDNKLFLLSPECLSV